MMKFTGKLKEPTVITENAKVSYLSIYDDDIYGILDNSRIIKLKDGKAKVQTLYEGTCYYMQVTKSGIYFTDEKNHYCKVDLDGKDKEIIIEKEVYYPYQVNAKFLVYQDDAGNDACVTILEKVEETPRCNHNATTDEIETPYSVAVYISPDERCRQGSCHAA